MRNQYKRNACHCCKPDAGLSWARYRLQADISGDDNELIKLSKGAEEKTQGPDVTPRCRVTACASTKKTFDFMVMASQSRHFSLAWVDIPLAYQPESPSQHE